MLTLEDVPGNVRRATDAHHATESMPPIAEEPGSPKTVLKTLMTRKKAFLMKAECTKEEVCFIWAAYLRMQKTAQKDPSRFTRRNVIMELRAAFERTRFRASAYGRHKLGVLFTDKLYNPDPEFVDHVYALAVHSSDVGLRDVIELFYNDYDLLHEYRIHEEAAQIMASAVEADRNEDPLRTNGSPNLSLGNISSSNGSPSRSPGRSPNGKSPGVRSPARHARSSGDGSKLSDGMSNCIPKADAVQGLPIHISKGKQIHNAQNANAPAIGAQGSSSSKQTSKMMHGGDTEKDAISDLIPLEIAIGEVEMSPQYFEMKHNILKIRDLIIDCLEASQKAHFEKEGITISNGLTIGELIEGGLVDENFARYMYPKAFESLQAKQHEHNVCNKKNSPAKLQGSEESASKPAKLQGSGSQNTVGKLLSIREPSSSPVQSTGGKGGHLSITEPPSPSRIKEISCIATEINLETGEKTKTDMTPYQTPNTTTENFFPKKNSEQQSSGASGVELSKTGLGSKETDKEKEFKEAEREITINEFLQKLVKPNYSKLLAKEFKLMLDKKRNKQKMDRARIEMGANILVDEKLMRHQGYYETVQLPGAPCNSGHSDDNGGHVGLMLSVDVNSPISVERASKAGLSPLGSGSNDNFGSPMNLSPLNERASPMGVGNVPSQIEGSTSKKTTTIGEAENCYGKSPSDKPFIHARTNSNNNHPPEPINTNVNDRAERGNVVNPHSFPNGTNPYALPFPNGTNPYSAVRSSNADIKTDSDVRSNLHTASEMGGASTVSESLPRFGEDRPFSYEQVEYRSPQQTPNFANLYYPEGGTTDDNTESIENDIIATSMPNDKVEDGEKTAEDDEEPPIEENSPIEENHYEDDFQDDDDSRADALVANASKPSTMQFNDDDDDDPDHLTMLEDSVSQRRSKEINEMVGLFRENQTEKSGFNGLNGGLTPPNGGLTPPLDSIAEESRQNSKASRQPSNGNVGRQASERNVSERKASSEKSQSKESLGAATAGGADDAADYEGGFQGEQGQGNFAGAHMQDANTTLQTDASAGKATHGNQEVDAGRSPSKKLEDSSTVELSAGQPAGAKVQDPMVKISSSDTLAGARSVRSASFTSSVNEYCTHMIIDELLENAMSITSEGSSLTGGDTKHDKTLSMKNKKDRDSQKSSKERGEQKSVILPPIPGMGIPKRESSRVFDHEKVTTITPRQGPPIVFVGEKSQAEKEATTPGGVTPRDTTPRGGYRSEIGYPSRRRTISPGHSPRTEAASSTPDQQIYKSLIGGKGELEMRENREVASVVITPREEDTSSKTQELRLHLAANPHLLEGTDVYNAAIDRQAQFEANEQDRAERMLRKKQSLDDYDRALGVDPTRTEDENFQACISLASQNVINEINFLDVEDNKGDVMESTFNNLGPDEITKINGAVNRSGTDIGAGGAAGTGAGQGGASGPTAVKIPSNASAASAGGIVPPKGVLKTSSKIDMVVSGNTDYDPNYSDDSFEAEEEERRREPFVYNNTRTDPESDRNTMAGFMNKLNDVSVDGNKMWRKGDEKTLVEKIGFERQKTQEKRKERKPKGKRRAWEKADAFFTRHGDLIEARDKLDLFPEEINPDGPLNLFPMGELEHRRVKQHAMLSKRIDKKEKDIDWLQRKLEETQELLHQETLQLKRLEMERNRRTFPESGLKLPTIQKSYSENLLMSQCGNPVGTQGLFQVNPMIHPQTGLQMGIAHSRGPSPDHSPSPGQPSPSSPIGKKVNHKGDKSTLPKCITGEQVVIKTQKNEPMINGKSSKEVLNRFARDLNSMSPGGGGGGGQGMMDRSDGAPPGRRLKNDYHPQAKSSDGRQSLGKKYGAESSETTTPRGGTHNIKDGGDLRGTHHKDSTDPEGNKLLGDNTWDNKQWEPISKVRGFGNERIPRIAVAPVEDYVRCNSRGKKKFSHDVFTDFVQANNRDKQDRSVKHPMRHMSVPNWIHAAKRESTVTRVLSGMKSQDQLFSDHLYYSNSGQKVARQKALVENQKRHAPNLDFELATLKKLRKLVHKSNRQVAENTVTQGFGGPGSGPTQVPKRHELEEFFSQPFVKEFMQDELDTTHKEKPSNKRQHQELRRKKLEKKQAEANLKFARVQSIAQELFGELISATREKSNYESKAVKEFRRELKEDLGEIE